MSTYLYLKCLDHSPPLLSERESGQHLTDLPQIRADIKDPMAAAFTAGNDHLRAATVAFMTAHPSCRIGIEDEYGTDHTEEDETVPATPAARAGESCSHLAVHAHPSGAICDWCGTVLTIDEWQAIAAAHHREDRT